jgi:hypothetical protein
MSKICPKLKFQLKDNSIKMASKCLSNSFDNWLYFELESEKSPDARNNVASFSGVELNRTQVDDRMGRTLPNFDAEGVLSTPAMIQQLDSKVQRLVR